ncbi:unnamed protein product [Merluccius merluccius]
MPASRRYPQPPLAPKSLLASPRGKQLPGRRKTTTTWKHLPAPAGEEDAVPRPAVLRKMEVQSGVQQLEPLPPDAAFPPSGANQRSECEEGHVDTGASADSHSKDTPPASQRDDKKVRLWLLTAACPL